MWNKQIAISKTNETIPHAPFRNPRPVHDFHGAQMLKKQSNISELELRSVRMYSSVSRFASTRSVSTTHVTDVSAFTK